MKTNQVILILSILFAAFFLSACASKEIVIDSYQQSTFQTAKELEPSCPKGITNDPYPGSCVLYADNNKDSICDLSE
jgi:hypothetical protein